MLLGCGDSLESENRRLEAELKEKQRQLAAEEKNKKLKEELRRYELAGTYELRVGKDVGKLVIIENGDYEGWENGKLDEKGTWEIVGEEIHLNMKREKGIFKIQSNGDLTGIGYYDDKGNREELPKARQKTLKKIK